MMSLLLFCIIVLIWGSTWIAIKKQLGTVDPAVSVAYRFLLAAVLMLAWTTLRRLPMRFTRSSHVRFMLIGLLQYAVNYVFFYYASSHMVSGLVSVVFAISVVFNIANSRLFLKRPVSARVVGAACGGLLGLFLVFATQITSSGGSGSTLVGISLGLAGTLSFSLGNIVSAKAQNADLPIVQTTAWSMLYGAIFTSLGCLVTDRHFSISFSPTYMISLFYLAIFGSAVAFIAYLTLLHRIGPERAGYATVIFPVVSLAISTIYEGYHWTALSVIGALLVIAANGVILLKPFRVRSRPDGDEQVNGQSGPRAALVLSAKRTAAILGLSRKRSGFSRARSASPDSSARSNMRK
jgi:drug/metabolite transporter (DMT)-like permease